MSGERGFNGQELLRTFFDRPATEVAPEISDSWIEHDRRPIVSEGKGKILALVTQGGTARFFRIKEVYTYTNEYTYDRWPNSRGPEIDSMQPGDLITYVSRASTLTFIKTRGAENIQFSHLEEVNRFGDPVRNDNSELNASGVAKVTGLTHKDRSHLEYLNFRGEDAFILVPGSQTLTEEDLKRIEEEILGDVSISDEKLEEIEKEILSDPGK